MHNWQQTVYVFD